MVHWMAPSATINKEVNTTIKYPVTSLSYYKETEVCCKEILWNQFCNTVLADLELFVDYSFASLPCLSQGSERQWKLHSRCWIHGRIEQMSRPKDKENELVLFMKMVPFLIQLGTVLWTFTIQKILRTTPISGFISAVWELLQPGKVEFWDFQQSS